MLDLRAGKSTVASLLLRFQNPIKGQITIGDMDISLDLEDIERVWLCTQEVILFGEDIRTNIAYGKIEATDEEVKESCKKGICS